MVADFQLPGDFAQVACGFVGCAGYFRGLVLDGEDYVANRDYFGLFGYGAFGDYAAVGLNLAERCDMGEVGVCALVAAENHPSFHRLQRLNHAEGLLDGLGGFAADAKQDGVWTSWRDDDSVFFCVYVVEGVGLEGFVHFKDGGFVDLAFGADVFGFAVGDEFEGVVVLEGFADGCGCADDSAFGVVALGLGVEFFEELCGFFEGDYGYGGFFGEC